MDSGFFTFFLPLTLAVMMMGLGLQLTPKDFIRVNQFPKVIFFNAFFTIGHFACFSIFNLFIFRIATAIGNWLNAACCLTRGAYCKLI